eukprot:FR738843.1.p1 GENE.FR738843.1~~FR738843.1.p1  ORF type:complete len:106 (+),score=10.27 FR738843.1:24-320(+)
MRLAPLTSMDYVRGNFFRTMLVVFLTVVAISAVKSLEHIVSLLGAALGIPLGFIFPLMVHLKVVKDSSWMVKAINYLFIAIATGLSLVCCAVTITHWE